MTTETLAWMARYTRELYEGLEAETGLSTGLRGPTPGGGARLPHLGTDPISLTRHAHSRAFPYFTAQQIDLEYALGWAFRMSFVGELG